ncbi:hypothetical protein, partial [Novipirellula herctigrandis]|uniref:hypothetical protein n=1 Tax=Novipirellula herctigrandis TaxID=2527986 RepID=UPI003AF3746B
VFLMPNSESNSYESPHKTNPNQETPCTSSRTAEASPMGFGKQCLLALSVFLMVTLLAVCSFLAWVMFQWLQFT